MTARSARSLPRPAAWKAWRWPAIIILSLPWFSLAASGPEPQLPFEPYPRSKLDQYTERSVADYTLPMSAWRRIGGEWQLERSERLSGELQRATYRIDDGHAPAEAHAWWLERLQGLGARSLFSCRGRACGSSNLWANNAFGNRELYGLDESQRYDALALEHQDRSYAVAIYSVERGNRRVYSHLDVVSLAGDAADDLSATPDGLLVALRERGYVVLAESPVDASAPIIDTLAQALRKDMALEVFLVGHAYGNASLDVLRSRSAATVTAIAGELSRRGIAAKRLHPVGVGPLAPRGGKWRDRVEVVVTRPFTR